MNLIDENVERESEEKQKKITKIIIITIIALVAIAAVILIYSNIKKKNTLTLSIDKKDQKFSSDMFLMADKKNLYTTEDGQIYISVKKLANLLNVSYYNDEYKGRGEDVTKCYIKTDNEYTSYISGSSTIYKVIDNKSIIEAEKANQKSTSSSQNDITDIGVNEYEYEYFSIDDGVRYENNEIYARKDAIELGFNVNIIYDKKNKSIAIYTLNGLQKTAAGIVTSAVTDDSLSYRNKKLLKYGYVLIKNGSNAYGVANYANYQEGNYVLSCKYSEIQFIESLGCLLVTTADENDKGVLKIDLIGDENVKTVVEPRYEEINQLSDDGSLYLVKENSRYGIVKITEDNDSNQINAETILKSEYQTIGLNDYKNYDDMDSRYIIAGKYIPVKRDNKWGIISTEGKVLIIPQYDEIGCSTSESGKPVIILPNLRANGDAIVFGTSTTDEANVTTVSYALVNAKTNEKIAENAIEIYSVYNNNENQYFMKVMLPNGTPYRYNIYTVFGKKTSTNTTGAQSTTTSNTQSN